MLTTTVILMSLGVEPGNARLTTSGRTDTAGESFANSFDEGAALAGAMQTQIADGLIPKDAAGPKNIAPENIAPAKEVDVSALALAGAKTGMGGKNHIQSQFNIANKPVFTRTDKVVDTTSAGVKVAISATSVPPHKGSCDKDMSAVAQIKMPDDQLFAGDVDGIVQNLLPKNGESVKTGAPDGTAVPQTDDAGFEMPPVSNTGGKPVIQNQKEITAIGDGSEMAPMENIAKCQGDIAKTEKPVKTGKKEHVTTAEKAEMAAGAMEPVLGIAAQIVTVIPIPAPSDQQYKSTKQESTDLVSNASATAWRSIGPISLIDEKSDKKAASVGKLEGDTNTPISALIDDGTSKKSEADVRKMAAPATSVTAEGDTKAQSTAASSAMMTPAHPGVGVLPGAVAGVIPGMDLLHVAAKPQTTEASSHAVVMQGEVGMQMSAGASDGVGQVHRTLMATPTALEVGVANGTHGWLKIRAEMTGGGVVNASLSTASSSGQEMLHRELPSLTAYLQSERVAVNTVVVQPSVATGTDFRGLAGGMNSEGRGQAQQSGSQGGENRQDAMRTVMNRVEKDFPYTNLNGSVGDELLLRVSYAGGGSWLSVRA